MDSTNAVDVIRELVNTNRDGEKGYLDAAEHAKSADLKTYFRKQGSERARFATQLDAELRKLGQDTKKEDGHVAGTLHRAWIDVKQTLGGGDHSLLESVEQGEDKAKESYQKAMQSALPEHVLAIVREQAQAIFVAHDQVKALRDRKAA